MSSKIKHGWLRIVAIALMMLVATPVYARSMSMKDAGFAVWIFIIIGAVIVLLQLVPAAILFFSFIGTTSAVIFRGKKKEEEEAEMAADLEPAPVKK